MRVQKPSTSESIFAAEGCGSPPQTVVTTSRSALPAPGGIWAAAPAPAAAAIVAAGRPGSAAPSSATVLPADLPPWARWLAAAVGPEAAPEPVPARPDALTGPSPGR